MVVLLLLVCHVLQPFPRDYEGISTTFHTPIFRPPSRYLVNERKAVLGMETPFKGWKGDDEKSGGDERFLETGGG
jgi:hypothetical protein